MVAELRAAGYLESTIGQYAKTIRALARYVAGRGGVYSPGLGAGFASMTISPRTGPVQRAAAVGLPPAGRRVRLATCGPGGWTCRFAAAAAGDRGPSSAAFAALDAAWEAEMDRAGPGAGHARRLTGGWRAATWCSWSNAGSPAWTAADGASVLAFLESLLDRWAKSSLFWVVSNFRPFLKFTGRADLVDAVNLAGVRRSHPIIAVLGDEDEDMVVAGVRVGGGGRAGRGDHAAGADDGAAGLRHRRRCAWPISTGAARRSAIVQQKTGNPLTLPLPALVVARLADYVLDERPGSADDHVFVRSVAPHVRLADHASVHRVIAATFRKAGVTDVRVGTRFLRHNAASRLLRAAVPLPTISAVLGHASQDSTNLYMSVDRERLLECVLPGSRGSTAMSGARFHQRVRCRPGRLPGVQAEHGLLRRLPHLVPAKVRRLVQPARPDRLRPGHRRGMGERSAGKLGPLPVVDVLHPRLRPVAAGHRASDACVLSDRWKAPFVPPRPYLLSSRRSSRSSPRPRHCKPSPRGDGRRSRSSR